MIVACTFFPTTFLEIAVYRKGQMRQLPLPLPLPLEIKDKAERKQGFYHP